ncbi:hypothetical protein CYMTET_3352 [Cymbomonas tetramitiformis]|uniref:Fe2OG dioxygenase domain-containing protein n=1 Tax=Cymbomonas tetramitiformis TaxID=36881 RepID=A0AAE0H594_9CHLO|nr:hypothetical protein CYMTET_3352 [Cymbomonas tetramitiformis]
MQVGPGAARYSTLSCSTPKPCVTSRWLRPLPTSSRASNRLRSSCIAGRVAPDDSAHLALCPRLIPYRFSEWHAVQIEAAKHCWHGAEATGTLSVNQKGSEDAREFFLLKNLLTCKEAESIADQSREFGIEYDPEPDSVDGCPAFHSLIVQHGQILNPALASLLKPILQTRILPYVKARFASPTITLCDAFIRRYQQHERLTISNHFDALAFATVVVDLNPQDHTGGLYVQAGAGAESRRFCEVTPGDAVVHQFDLQHGVHVYEGHRQSLVLWFCDSEQSCAEGSARWLLPASEGGNTDAQFNLAGLYDHGSGGFPQDLDEAIRWYQRSAEAGNPFSQNRLGTLHELGRGVEQDPCRAVHFWRLAAEQGNPQAQFALGEAWWACYGVHEQNQGLAIELFAAAAQQGHAGAQHALGEAYLEGAERLPSSQVHAEECFLAAAQQQHADAQFSLALCLRARAAIAGNADDANLDETAQQWLKRAAAQGHGGAIAALKQRQ